MARKGQRSGTKIQSKTFNAKWLRNAAKSVGIGYSEALKSISPNLYETAAIGRDVTNTIVKNLVSNRTGQERVRNTLQNNKYVSAMQTAYKNAVSDIKSGNFAGNDNRPSSFSSSGGEDSGFTFGEEKIESPKMSESGAAALSINTQNQNIAMANIKMQKASMDATIALTSASMQQSATIGAEVINQLTNINSSLQALVQFNNENMNRLIESSTTYFEKAGSSLESKNDDKINLNDVFNNNKGININNYKKYTKQQFKSMVNNSELGAAFQMLTSDAMLEGLASNPLGFAAQGLSAYLIPKMMRTSIETMEQAYNNYLPTLLTEIADLAEDESAGFAGKLRRAIGKTFGIKSDNRGKFNDHQVERGAISFDGETKHAITEIITKELRDQTGYLRVLAEKVVGADYQKKADAGKEYWDFSTNSYIKGKDAINQNIAQTIVDSVTSSIQTTLFGKEFSKASLNSSDVDSGVIDKAIEEVYFEMTRRSGNITEEMLTQIINSCHSDETVKKILRDHLKNMRESNADAYNNMRFAQIKGRNAKSGVYEEIDKDQVGYNVNNSSYANRYTEDVYYKSDVKDPKTGKIIHNKGDLKHEKGERVNADDITANTIFKNNKQTKVSESQGSLYTSNGAVEDAKGIIGTITKSMNSFISGVLNGSSAVEIVKNVSGVIGTQVDKIGDGVKEHLFGSDDGNGNKNGGIFSGVSNFFKDTASSLKYFITGKGYTDSKGQRYEDDDNSVLANLKNVGNVVKDGVMEKLFGKTKDENGEYQKSKEGLFGSIVDTFKQGFNGWMDAFFGEGTDCETPDERRKKMMQGIKEYTKENLPEAVTGGVVGAIGGGMMGSSLLGMLVGGPMFGAVAGAATGFLAKSKTFQNIVFGEEDENGERLGGLISKKTQDFVKENKNMLVGSAATGALTGGITGGGILGMLVGGPVAGALMGMATGIVVKSDKFQTLIFGEKGEDGKRSGGVIKNITDAFNKHFKGEKEPGNRKAAGMGAIGAGAGALTAAIVGKMGILGAALTPAGPIGGAIIGLGLGIKAAGGNFKEWLFGKKGGLDNLHGKSDKQGVIGQIGNTINANLLLPIKTQGTIFMKQLAFTMEHDIVKPIAIAGEAIADKAGEIVSGLKETVGGAVKGFLENTKDVVFGKDDGNGNREGGILSPAINAVSGVLNTAATAIRKTMIGMISIPGRILRTGMSIVSSKIVEGFRTVAKPVRRLFKDIRTVIFSGIKGVFKLAFKGVSGIFKVATAPFRWVFGLGAAAGRSIKRRVSSFARKKLGDKADKIREKWAESGRNTGTIFSRMRDNLVVANSERAEDKEKLNKEIETLKRHAENANYISRYTKGQFSVDTDEARDWLKMVNPRAYKKLISGKSLGKGYKGENLSVTEENERARIAREGEDISGGTLSDLERANPDRLDYKSKILYFLKGIAGDTSTLADETETGHKLTRQEKKDKKDNERLEKDAKRLGITFDDDMNLAEKEKLVREKQAEFDEARKEKYKNKYKNNNGEGEDEGSDEATGGPGLTEYLKGSFKGLKDWFFGYNEPGTKGKASTNGDIIQRTAAPVLEVGKDFKSALGRTWIGERLNAGIENVRSKEEELRNQGGNGTRIIYHKPLGGRGILSTLAKTGLSAGKAIGNAASSVSDMFGGDSDTSENDEKSKGLFSKLAGGIGNSISSLFDKFSKSSDSDLDGISDEEEADERQSDEERRSSSRKRRRRGSKAKTRKDSADATYATQEDIASEYSDKADDMTQLANSRSKNAKQLQDQRKMEKQQEEQTRYAKISALASTAGSKASEKIQSMFSKIFSKDGLKIAGLAGGLTLLNKYFPELLSSVGSVAENILKFLGKNAEEVSWTNENNARTNGNSAVEEAGRIGKNALSGNILQLNDDGSASSLTTPTSKYGVRLGYDLFSPNAKQSTHFWNSKAAKRRAKFNKGFQQVRQKAGGKLKSIGSNIKSRIKSQKDFNDILDSMINTQGYEPDEALEVLKGSMDEKDFEKFQKSNKLTSSVKNALSSTKTKIANSKAGKSVGNLKNSIKNLATETAEKAKGTKGGQIISKIKGYIDDFFETITKKFTKKAGKDSAKGLSKLKSLKKLIFEGLEKAIGKISPKAAEIIGKHGGLAAMTAGASEAVFLIGGAIDGATGAAKLFHIDKGSVDFKMITIASILGAFNGTTVGSICDLVFSTIDSIVGTQIYSTLATVLYNAWSGGENSKGGKKLAEAQAKFKDDYLKYQTKELKSQYNAQKKAGIIGSDVTLEQFIAGVEDGTYNAEYDSEDDYNTKKNGSISDKVMSGVGKGAKTLWNKAFGSKTVYEKDGITYQKSSDGKYHAYQDGEDLGVIAENSIPKDAKKTTKDTIGRKAVKAVGGGLKKVGSSVVNGVKTAGKTVGNFLTNPIGTMKDGFNSAKDAIVNSKAVKVLTNITRNIGKPVLDYLIAKTDSVTFDCPDDNPGKPIIDTMAKALQFGLWIPHTEIKVGRYIASFIGKAIKRAADAGKSIMKGSIDYAIGKTDTIEMSTEDDNPLNPAVNAINKVEQFLLFTPHITTKIFRGIGKWIGKHIDDISEAGTTLVKGTKDFITDKVDDITVKVSEDNPLKTVLDVVSKIAKVVLTPVKIIGNIFKPIGDAVSNTITDVKDGVETITSAISDKVKGVGNAVKGAWNWATGGNGKGFGGRGDNEEYFSQNDPRWKNARYGNDGARMGDSGCGPAAMAMAINTAIDRGGRGVNPMQMAGLAQATGNRDETGTNWNFMSEAPALMGIGSKQALSPSAEYINSELDSGRPVILSGKTGGFGGRSAFTNAGHYVVATGKDNQGNIIIKDPRGTSYSGKYNVADVARETGSAWTIGGFGKKNKNKNKKGSATSNGKDWLSIVKACKKSIGDQKKGYSQSGYIDVTVDGKTINTRRDCSGFVSVCLSFYTGKKLITNSSGFESDPNIANYLKSAGFSKMNWPGFEGTQAGDIYCTGGSHVEICAESGTKRVYNCGSNDSCNNPGITNSGHSGYNCIWRPGNPGTGGQDLTTGTTSDVSASDSASVDSSGTTSIFDQLSSAFNNVFTEAQNRLLKGDTNTDFTSVALNGLNGNSSNTPSSGGSVDDSSIDAAKIKGSKVADKTFNYFRSKGYSDAAIAGILGNAQQESGLNPSSGKGKGPAYGIWQWESGRFANLQNAAKKAGTTWEDPDIQIKHLANELSNPSVAYFGKSATYGSNIGHGAAGKTNWEVAGTNKVSFEQFKNATDPAQAARQFEAAVERASWPRMENRVKYAKGFYDQYANKGGKGGGFGSGPSTITKRNFANSLGYDLGGYGKKKIAAKEINNKFVTDRQARFYRNTNKNSTTDELLYNMILILSHIAANTKRADNKLADIKSYSKETASNSIKKKKNSKNNDEITTQNNYYIVKDGTPQLKYTEKRSNSTRADNIAYEIAKGGY